MIIVFLWYSKNKISITRRGRGKGKQVDMPAKEGMSRLPPNQASQVGANAEISSRSSSTFPALEEPVGREVPAEPPMNTTDQDPRNAVHMLTQLVAAQSQGQTGPMTHEDDAARVASRKTQDFLKLDPPIFTGSDLKADPQDFVDQIQRALEVMHVTGVETVELTAYRLKGEAILWYEDWKKARGIGANPPTWEEFKATFLDHYLP